MDISFTNKTAIVTGGGSGIGETVSLELAASGANVIVADMDTSGADKVVKTIRQKGGNAESFEIDVTDASACEAMVAFAIKTYGGLHLAVNNAGIGGPAAPIGEYPVDGWEKVISVNLNGVFNCVRYQIPAMLEAGGGAIVNMASILGTVGFANSSAYTAAKHGVVGMTKAAALEYAARNIRINAVGPGFIDTPLLSANLDQAALDGLASLHPVGRIGTPEEVSALTCFLLSDRASFINGSYHRVDGAYTAQ
ncbi:SDR family NAD(P)-dependent oxidoreductase [Mariluticola halotolerans]|uniref:SDR family NAD(P)-dependent oxidoreductase n=1 Tax=Mariluticola halotolerans TaxID=2909283 RepID=UPI0026E3E2CC|nr:3-oxoacyl-ACP reductase FabG [Mariluticola halotolerans]UJQ93825.1 3-oxoacyl-ACP reductase FabG [Mariluticola halotolerans]